ncbi:hypothetical protein ACWC10_26505 [Streptomyces sp. NPDC001595]|uniref:hypothetical protein n=1 Tax=Streptomyces sp. NPDC001532 TaxID=3154520 RepID=UPI0033293A99
MTEPETAPASTPEPAALAAPAPGPDAAPAPALDAAPAPGPDAAPALDAVPAPASDAVPAPDAVPVADKPGKKVLRLGRVGKAAGALVVAGAVVAGVGYTVVTVRDADRDAGEPVYTLPKHASESAEPVAATGLAGMLLPYGEAWERGPDLGEFGSEAQLDGERAAALRKEALRELPRTQRKRLERQIDKQRVQGMAMRSYVTAGDLFAGEETVTVSVVLTRMENKAAVRDISTFQNEFLAALDVLRKGPRIKGHKNAQCFLPPSDEVEEGGLDTMLCSAYEGDVLVSLTASGPASLNSGDVAELLTAQLDRIEEPGKAV